MRLWGALTAPAERIGGMGGCPHAPRANRKQNIIHGLHLTACTARRSATDDALIGVAIGCLVCAQPDFLGGEQGFHGSLEIGLHEALPLGLDVQIVKCSLALLHIMRMASGQLRRDGRAREAWACRRGTP
jgi:hypothetical protein